MRFLEVLSPGLLTTVQDLGRPGYEHLGLSPSGAADSIALRLGNRLVGNSPHQAALEMTLVGASFRFESETIIALTGADLGACLDDQALELWRSHRVRAGQVLKTGPARSGCRGYLCIQNGIDVPLVLGSASTHIQSKIGGYQGRGLKKGDRVPIREGKLTDPKLRICVEALQFLLPVGKVLRVTDSVHTDLFSPAAMQEFLSQDYLVTEHSNRLGLRLEGNPLAGIPEVLTTGVSLGSIQLSSGGKPTVLFVEQQLTGGYPQIACVILADHPAIGQLRPRDRVRFKKASLEKAVGAFRAQEEVLSSDRIFR